MVPGPCGLDVGGIASDVAEVSERDQVLGVESERGVKDLPGLIEATSLVERLREHDVPADVRGLLRQVGSTERDGLV